jgi:uncharacterized protein YodC (DUF2158 family)
MSVIVEKMLVLIGKLKDTFLPRPKKFKVGDMVELKDGTGYPMLVIEVNHIKNKQEPLVYCRWYDRKTKETKMNFFNESALTHFDWSSK